MREKKKRVVVSDEAFQTFENIRKELRKRGNAHFNSKHFLDQVLKSLPRSFFDDYQDQQTPLEFRIKEALKDESKRAEIEKIFGKPSRTHKKPASEPASDPTP